MATTNVTEGGAINRNADWYYANLDELLPKYDGKFVAISGEQVVGAFDTFGGGVHAMLDAGHQPGTFIVHHCLSPQAEKEEYYFHSNRVNFCPAP